MGIFTLMFVSVYSVGWGFGVCFLLFRHGYDHFVDA
jgi:hypothetical protein